MNAYQNARAWKAIHEIPGDADPRSWLSQLDRAEALAADPKTRRTRAALAAQIRERVRAALATDSPMMEADRARCRIALAKSQNANAAWHCYTEACNGTVRPTTMIPQEILLGASDHRADLSCRFFQRPFQ